MPRLRLRKRPQGIVSRARAIELTHQTAQRARAARRELALLIPLTAATVFAYVQRDELFGVDRPARIVTAAVLVVLGAALARDIGRSLAPALFRRMDPSTAGTVGFLIRLAFLAITVVVALRLAGLDPQTLAVGGAITAVVIGLAAQQTFGNVFAGLVLTSSRPFKVGDRVRLQAGNVAGTLEGDVTSVGLLYTTFAQGDDVMLVPNTVVLSAAVVPLREPAGVDLRARLRPDVRVTEVQRLLRERVRVRVRGEAHIALEELDADEVVIRVTAVPDADTDGPRLADEILTALEAVTRSGHTEERRILRRYSAV